MRLREIELSFVVRDAVAPLGTVVNQPEKVADAFRFLEGRTKEQFWMAILDGRHSIVGIHRVSEGTVGASLVHPREVFLPALHAAASAIIVVHNHPSGHPDPSEEDIAVTKRLIESGRLLGIPVLDHVVIGRGRFTSLRREGLVDFQSTTMLTQ